MHERLAFTEGKLYIEQDSRKSVFFWKMKISCIKGNKKSQMSEDEEHWFVKYIILAVPSSNPSLIMSPEASIDWLHKCNTPLYRFLSYLQDTHQSEDMPNTRFYRNIASDEDTLNTHHSTPIVSSRTFKPQWQSDERKDLVLLFVLLHYQMWHFFWVPGFPKVVININMPWPLERAY